MTINQPALRLAAVIAIAGGALAAQDYASCARDPATLAACLREQAKLAKGAAITAPVQGLTSAGGKWTVETQEDKLVGNEELSDGIGSGFPSFGIACAGGKWIDSVLFSSVVLGTGAPRGGLLSNIPQQVVFLRSGTKIRVHFWNIAEDYRRLFADRGATKELLSTDDARVKFGDARGHDQTALFSPAGLDREKLEAACGAKTFK
jgi:hypothetical protein